METTLETPPVEESKIHDSASPKKKSAKGGLKKKKEVSAGAPPPDLIGVEPPATLWRTRRIGDKEFTTRNGTKYTGVLHLAGKGSTPADVMFISPCALYEEIWPGFSLNPGVLQGAPGNVFLRNLGRSGFDSKDWFYTNLVKYNVPRFKIKAHDIRWNMPALENEIATVKPKIIVCLGKIVFDQFSPYKFKLKDVQGGFFRSEKHDCLVYPMDTVMMACMKPEYLERFLIDLREVKRALDDTRGIVVDKVPTEYFVIRNLSELCKIVDQVIACKPSVLAVDCEWDGQTYVNGKLRSIQFSWAKGKAACVSLMDEKVQYAFDVPLAEVGKILSPLFNDPKIKFIGHNFVADALWMESHLNINTYKRCQFDTMFAQQTLNEYADLKLERLAVAYTDLGRYDLELTLWKKKTKFDEEENDGYGKVPDSILVPYSLRDVDATFRLYPILFKKLLHQKLSDYYFRCVLPFVTDGFHELTSTGLPINLEYLTELRTVFTRNTAILVEEFRKSMYVDASKIFKEELAKVDPDSDQHLEVYATCEDVHNQHTDKFRGADGVVVLNQTSTEFGVALSAVKSFVPADKLGEVLPFFLHWWNSPAFNIGSTDHLNRWLFQVRKFTPLKTTKKDGIQIAWEKVLSLPADRQTQYTPAVDKQTIRVLADKDPLVAQIQELKSVSNIVKAFLKGPDEDGKEQGMHKWVQSDGRIHSNFAMTETGRPRAWKPNVLNYPKSTSKWIESAFVRIQKTYPEHSEKPASLRSAVQAPDGWCLIDMDLKTAEVVALAYLSGDDNMIRVLTEPDFQFARCSKEDKKKVLRICYNNNEGLQEAEQDPALLVPVDDSRLLRDDKGLLIHPKRDLHWEMGTYVMGQPREKLDDRMARDGIGKITNFSVPYGASPTLLERMIEVNTGKKPSDGTGQKMIDGYCARYPIADRYLKRMEAMVEDPGWFRSISGKIRHFHYTDLSDVRGLSEKTRKNILSPLVRQARNFPIQSLVGDTTAKALLRFVEDRKDLGLQARVMMLLYDAVAILTPLEEAKEAMRLLRHHLTEANTWTVHGKTFHFDVDETVAFRWGVKLTKEQEKAIAVHFQ